MQPPGRGALSFLRRAGFQREDIISHAVNCVDKLTGPQFINGTAYCQPVVSVCRGELGQRGQSGARPGMCRPSRDSAWSLARKERLEQESPDLRIYLQGVWLAEVPPRLLCCETKVNVLRR
jgi:hypothetical protein